MMKKQVYNPYLPIDEYIPDGEPHVFGDRVYVYGSHDREGGTKYCELDYVVYSAPVDDLKEWRCEGTVYRAKQDPNYSIDRCEMYAPDVVRGNDGRYYLYYALAGFEGPISVAVCDTPAGKYEYLGYVRYPDGKPLNRFLMFDPALINDNGTIRLYYGWSLATKRPDSLEEQKMYDEMMQRMFQKSQEELQSEPQSVMGANTVELENDMMTVKGEPVRIVPGANMADGTSFEGHAFFEASSIRKVGELYYFIYSSCLFHELCYAVSKYPDREFQYGGVIVSNGDIGINGRKEEDRLAATGNNHGSIEHINGEWYIFYHRNTHLNSFNRQGCAEKIEISPEGKIHQVEMTSCGLNGGPLQGIGEYPAVIACNLTDGHMPHLGNEMIETYQPRITHGNGERYISNISKGTRIGYKYFEMYGKTKVIVSVRGDGNGEFSILADEEKEVGKVTVESAEAWKEYSTTIQLEGVYPLYFVYEGEGTIELLNIRFEKE